MKQILLTLFAFASLSLTAQTVVQPFALTDV